MDEQWVKLDTVIPECKECRHNAACKIIVLHAKRCINAQYRFRCPLEVLDTTED